ncbi:hypothetical protein ACFO25_04670 [Paenactinomyces guangxiensis]|uniref:Uncharacterized protein n=1 Tax=Paenactinomyces guangxiensis TaxID=1490290 RepID=A0A7W1WPI3_9BACL|nr:hypothetical protein [Paenactinomyces guangxiensis]MBA4493671.1 hypothetical protein [Paenactinomyces guangxiensis]MBH8590958.1 hypothetical protein [Paenactinomyces guangxiensis]
MKQRELTTIKKEDMVGKVVYVLAKLGYSRPEISKVTKELRNVLNLKCTGRIFDENLITGRVDRKNLLPTISDHGNDKIDG